MEFCILLPLADNTKLSSPVRLQLRGTPYFSKRFSSFSPPFRSMFRKTFRIFARKCVVFPFFSLFFFFLSNCNNFHEVNILNGNARKRFHETQGPKNKRDRCPGSWMRFFYLQKCARICAVLMAADWWKERTKYQDTGKQRGKTYIHPDCWSIQSVSNTDDTLV